MKPMAALALTAALYHVASHAFFKSLLFVGTGAVLHATGERSLGKLGGLIRYMPWVAWLTLVGDAGERGPAAARRLRLRMAAAAELSVHARAAQLVPQHAGPGRGGADRAGRGAVGLHDGEVLRRHLPRPAAREQPRPGARRRPVGARRHGLARARLRAARPAAGAVHPADRSGDAPARRRRPGRDRAPPAAGCWCRSTSSAPATAR